MTLIIDCCHYLKPRINPVYATHVCVLCVCVCAGVCVCVCSSLCGSDIYNFLLFAEATSYWENKCQLKGVVCLVSALWVGLSSRYLEQIWLQGPVRTGIERGILLDDMEWQSREKQKLSDFVKERCRDTQILKQTLFLWGVGGRLWIRGHCTVIWGPVFLHDPLLLFQLLACASRSFQPISSLPSASFLLHLSPDYPSSLCTLISLLPLSLFFVLDKAQVKSGPLSPQRKQMTVGFFFQPHFCRPPPKERSVSLGGEGEMRRID